MKDDKKESGEELIDIDEKGNPIEKIKEEKEKKSNTAYKIAIAVIVCLFILVACYFFINCKRNNKSVFDETTLKNLKLKSRVFLGPITHIPEKIENVVKNDVALVTTEGAIVGDYVFSKMQAEGPFRIDKDEFIPDLKKLADVVHKHNSYILLGILHYGLLNADQPMYSPSGGKGILNKEVESKAVTKEDILRIQDYFVQAAIRAKKAGFDGVEILGAQMNLISSFSSMKLNKRTDEYGGSDENRARFMVEIVKKVREAIGNDMIISAKIDSPDEENGYTEKGYLNLGKSLEEVGIDLIEISGPNGIRNEELYFYEPTKKIAETLNIPVICMGGIKTFEHADYILKNSKIEYISMSRQLMKQPYTVKNWSLNK